MHPILSIFVLLCVVTSAVGVHLMFRQEAQVLALVERTSGLILEKKIEHVHGFRARGTDRSRRVTVRFEPRVTYRFSANGREFVNDRIFPTEFRAGGNLGLMTVRAAIEPFKVGERIRVYYEPDDPHQSCLIRRPSILPYILVLAPIVFGCALVPFVWRRAPAPDVDFKRRRARWLAFIWYLAGAACAGHYFYVAGADYGIGALFLFGLYLHVGLVPFAFTLPPSHASQRSSRIKGVIGFSLFGAFIGFWLGVAISWVARKFFDASASFFFELWLYAMAGTIAAFTLLGVIGRAKATGEFREVPPEGVEPDTLEQTPAGAATDGAPYHIDQRPMPQGQDPEALLPPEVGSFRRTSLEVPADLSRSSVYAEYASASGDVFVELGVCATPAEARRALQTAHREIGAARDPQAWFSLGSEPAFLRAATPHGVFVAWARGPYYFSADARRGDKDLNRFMEAFPY